jgi:hypothetical protein
VIGITALAESGLFTTVRQLAEKHDTARMLFWRSSNVLCIEQNL